MRFEWFFGLSIFVHVLLMIGVSSNMDMLENEDVPIKARVNIRIESPRNISGEKKEHKSQKVKIKKPIKKPTLKKVSLKNVWKITVILS